MEKNQNILIALVLVGILIFISRQPAQPTQPIQDYTGLIDAGVSVTGRDLYEPGTSLASEDVRVIRNGIDLGYFSLDSTDIGVTSNVDYKFYFFMNTSPSTNYYVDVLSYTGLERDAVDDIYGQGCAVDSQPLFWVVTAGGATQTATSNAQSIAASGSAEILINIKSHSEKCYGAPDAKAEGEENTICFLYELSAVFDSIDTNTGNAPTPNSISSSGNATTRSIIDCFKFPVLANTEQIEIPLTIKAGATEPTSAYNITVMSEDICIFVDKSNLDGVWGTQDEDNNDICGATVELGTIYIS